MTSTSCGSSPHLSQSPHPLLNSQYLFLVAHGEGPDEAGLAIQCTPRPHLQQQPATDLSSFSPPATSSRDDPSVHCGVVPPADMSIDMHDVQEKPDSRPADTTESRQPAKQPRLSKKARMRRKDHTQPKSRPARAHNPTPLMKATLPRRPIILSQPQQPPSLDLATAQQAELDNLRTQLRDARAESKTYADANAELTRRALAAERESQVSARARAQAEHDASV